MSDNVTPLTLNSPTELLMNMQSSDLEGVEELAIIMRTKDGQLDLSHSKMSPEALHFLGAAIQNYVMRIYTEAAG